MRCFEMCDQKQLCLKIVGKFLKLRARNVSGALCSIGWETSHLRMEKKNKKCLNLSLTMASTESTGDDVFNEIRGFEKTRWVYIWLICALINKRWLPPADSQSQEGIQCIYSPCAMLICTFCKFCLFTFREEKMWRMFWVAASESDFRCWTF